MGAKSLHSDVFDKGLTQLSDSANWGGGVMKMAIVVGTPANQADASTLYPTGNRISDEIAMAVGDFTLQNKTGGGREVAIAAKAGTAQVDIPSLDSGNATGGTVNTLTDTAKAWGTNVYANKILKITGGTGAGQLVAIASNTGTVLTFASALATAPDNTSTYEIVEDLNVVLYDGGATPRMLVVDDVSSDQPIVNGNPLNASTFTLGMPQPV